MNPKSLDCGHAPSPHGQSDQGFGYDSAGKTFCYACAAEKDKQSLREGAATLYVVRGPLGINPAMQVTNWPGSLRIIPDKVQRLRHAGGFGSQRTDVWFTFEGAMYHGINRGDNDLLRVRRKKTNRIEAAV